MKLSAETYISNHRSILQPGGLRRQQTALTREDTLVWSFDKRTMDIYPTMVVRIIYSQEKILVIISLSRSFQKTYQPIRALEFAMDTAAFWIKSRAWIYGLYTEGFRGAHLAASGLTYHT